MKHTVVVAMAVLFLSVACCANTITYEASLSGASEVPSNGSPGTGFASVTIDDVANTMFVNVSFSGLTGTTTASHIHCCTATAGTGNAGVATQLPYFTALPLGVTSGSFMETLDLTLATSYNPAFITANGGTIASAEAVLLAGIAADKSYLNIHTTTFPGGEIRGYLVPVPEPATMTLMAGGLLGLIAKRRNTLRK
jgi:hypothetical protein